WEYPTGQNGEVVYDERFDKARQVGIAGRKLVEALEEYAKRESDPQKLEALNTIIDQLKLAIVGNTSKSVEKFETAYTYFLSTCTDNTPAFVTDLIDLANLIVTSTDSSEYIDPLFGILENYSIYILDQSMEEV